MTLQQFQKQSVSYKASTAPPLVPWSTQALPILNTVKSTLPAQKPLPSAEPAKMQSATQTLSSSFVKARSTDAPLHVIGSDAQGQRLEVVIPASALDLSKATTAKGAAPQGTLTLKLSQVRGHFSAATTDLGSFQMQLIDGQGAF